MKQEDKNKQHKEGHQPDDNSKERSLQESAGTAENTVIDDEEDYVATQGDRPNVATSAKRGLRIGAEMRKRVSSPNREPALTTLLTLTRNRNLRFRG